MINKHITPGVVLAISVFGYLILLQAASLWQNCQARQATQPKVTEEPEAPEVQTQDTHIVECAHLFEVCPFCGSKPKLYALPPCSGGIVDFFMQCDKCGARGPRRTNPFYSIRDWNKRVKLPPC